MMKDILKKSWPHLVAIGIFLAITMVYFSPALEGYGLRQHDVDQFKGSSKEIQDFREMFGNEPLWTNSQFGGMPATQISVDYSENLVLRVHRAFMSLLPHPINTVFLYFLGFYIMLQCMRVNPWLSIVGAIAFGLSSYFFIILAAGHNTKALAIAYMPPVIGGVYMAYRSKVLLGAGIAMLFMALQLSVNHPQVTYYMGWLIILMGIFELVRYIRKQELKKFAKISGLLIAGAVLAVLANSGRLYMTQEYVKDSQRGPTELTEKTLGKEGADVQTGGLDLEYMTRWSYGKGETFSFFIPNVKGGASGAVPFEDLEEGVGEGEVGQAVLNYARGNLKQSGSTGMSSYWGDQPGTSGPVYVGAGIMLLAILALFFVSNNLKWPLLIIMILATALGWGKNLMWFTELFANTVPLYDSFRAVTIILIMVEFAVPVLAILGLRKLFKDRAELEDKLRIPGTEKPVRKKYVYYGIAGLYGLILILFAIAPSTFFDFLSTQEAEMYANAQQKQPDQAQFIANLQTGLEEFRIGVFREDVLRSLGIAAVTFLFVFLYIRGAIKKSVVVIAGIGLITLIDLWAVDKRYLNNEETAPDTYAYWEPDIEKDIAHDATAADVAILENEMSIDEEVAKAVSAAWEQVESETGENPADVARKRYAKAFGALNMNTSYRVFEPFAESGAFNSARNSYFHKSIGGYSAIKLKRFNEFISLVLSADQSKLQQGFSQLNQIQAASQREATMKVQQILGEQTLARTTGLNMLNTKYIILNLKGEKGYYNPATDQGMFSSEHAGLINPYALGNAWLIENIQIVPDADEEIAAIRDFNPAKTAVLDQRFESEIEGKTSYSGEGSVSLTEYKPNHLKYEFNSAEDQFVVFSEVFYDRGWKAYIDDKEVPHVRVNYILRGMKVPSGEHEIEFKFSLRSYETTSTIALAGSTIILLLFAFVVFREVRSRMD